MLNPGSTTWLEAVPAFLVAVALLFVPGTVAGLLLRLRPFASLAAAPLLSTTCLAVSGIAAPLVGLRWSAAPLAAGIVLMWLAAALVGRWLPRLVTGRARAGSAVDDGRVPSRRTPDPLEEQPSGRWPRLVARLDSPGWAAVAGVAFAFVVVGYTLVRVSNTPEAFPQHPDTIFHLATPQWMIERGNISSLTANGYIVPSGKGFYPAAFHGFTATISMLSGVPVVVATSVFVLAIAGLVWPLGCIAFAQTLFGRRTPVVLAASATCVAFTGYPYFLMGFGVLWPNLFGETLLPAYLAAFTALVGVGGTQRVDGARVLDGIRSGQLYRLARRPTAAVVLLVGLPGLGLAHPNAVMSFGVFAIIYLVGRVLGGAWSVRRRPLLSAGLVLSVLVFLVAAFAASRVIAPPGMLLTGAIGPELGVDAALHDLVFFAPRGASYLPVLTCVVAVGMVALLVRHRGARWVVAAMVVMFGLYWVNVTVDARWTRSLTWPWYNNAVRLQAVAILPTVMAAAAGLVALVDLLALAMRRVTGSVLVATAAVVALFVLTTHAYVSAHGEILHRYFHPSAANSWASNPELRALHTLGERLPADAVVAANPWNGGTYLYVVSGRHLLVPTEKANAVGDRRLLSLRLDQVALDPRVCAAAQREGVEWAITGGRPFSWVGNRMQEFVGIDGVGGSRGWARVEKVGPYTLYHRIACAS